MPDRSPLTETIRRVQGMVSYVRENLSSDDYNLFLDMVDPQPEEVEKPKQTRKPREAKSQRASGMAEAIKSNHEAKAQANSDARCVAKVPTLDVPCGELEDALIHDPKGGYASYHPFQSAPSAKKKSKPREAFTLSVPSSATPPDSVGNAALAASGGD